MINRLATCIQELDIGSPSWNIHLSIMFPFTIHKTPAPPEFTGLWDGPVWSRSDTLSIDHFHPASSDHRPAVKAKVLYDASALYVHFKVNDRYVRCLQTRHQDPVCQDSCVEFFFKPRPDSGYLNMEANAGGTFLCSYIEDAHRTPAGFEKCIRIDPAWLERIPVYHSLPRLVEPELVSPVEWQLEYAIPLDLVEAYAGPLPPLAGQVWQANFFKCGDKTSHPHWGSWAPIGQVLNFHQPDRFAPVVFGC